MKLREISVSKAKLAMKDSFPKEGKINKLESYEAENRVNWYLIAVVPKKKIFVGRGEKGKNIVGDICHVVSHSQKANARAKGNKPETALKNTSKEEYYL